MVEDISVVWNNLIEWIIKYLPTAFIIVLIIALAIILAQVYKLKEEYETGVAIQNTCGDEFMERERGDYRVNNAYKTEVKDKLATSFKLLTGLVAFAGTAVISIHLFKVLLTDYQFTKDVTILPWNFNPKIVQGRNVIQRIIHILLFMIPTIYISILWFATTFDAADDYKIGGISLSPLKVSLSSKADMYAAQITQLLVLAGVTFLAVLYPMYNTSIRDKFSPEIKNLLWILIGVFIAGVLVIPAVSYVILNIRKPIDDYQLNYSRINIDKNDVEQVAAIKQNMYHTDPNKGIPEELPKDDEIRSYVTHNTNYSDLQAIQIPEQLKPFIHYSSLRGEAVLQLKRDLVSFYNDKNNTNKYSVDLQKSQTTFVNVHANSSIGGNNYDASLHDTIFKHLTKEYRDLLLQTNGANLDATSKEKRNKLLDTLNEYVITNTALGKANPFSSGTLTKLRQMRENTSIRDSVNSGFNVTTGIIFTVISVILLFIFRYLYSNVPNAATWISGVVILVLAVGTFVGFLTKDTWL